MFFRESTLSLKSQNFTIYLLDFLKFCFLVFFFQNLNRDDIIASGAGDDAIRLFVDSKHDSVREFHLMLHFKTDILFISMFLQ